MPTYFVPVTITVDAATADDAAVMVAQYLDDAAMAVYAPIGLTAVDVETDHVRAYVPEPESEPETESRRYPS